MLEEVVHIRQGGDPHSFCGEVLVKSTYDPFLFTTQYNPDRNLYCVYRVLTIGASYPVYEQVGIYNKPCFCDDCLAGIGLLLLRDFGEKPLSFM